MRGSYPATRNHKIVPLDHSSARLDSSITFFKTRGVTLQKLGTYISPSSSGTTSTRFLRKKTTNATHETGFFLTKTEKQKGMTLSDVQFDPVLKTIARKIV
jgi:hypothetical protein